VSRGARSLTALRKRAQAMIRESDLQELAAELGNDARAGARALGESCLRRAEKIGRERKRLEGLYQLRADLQARGVRLVAGVDEVGVGPLAGPVVAAAVVLGDSPDLPGLDDSKKLTPEKRETLDAAIRSQAVAIGICQVWTEEIDEINIFQATLRAMQGAVADLPVEPEHVLVDARRIPGISVPQTPIIGGDGKDASIAAASIVAKVHRDEIMRRFDAVYPGYGFARHKGYGTEEHLAALRHEGPCPIHRRSFGPVRVEKRLCNTEQVAKALARAAGVRPRDVGYAGRKDRVAVTRQWFSVPGLDPAEALALESEGWKVLEATPHQHKLRTGQLRENRFELVVRELAAEELACAEARLPEIARNGFPNRFGPQRFGREGDNAERGLEILLSGRMGRDKRQSRFLVSAFQAKLFNGYLDRRTLPLDRVATGEVAWKHDSGATFLVEDEALENVRAEAFEISPSGPIIGTRMPRPEGSPGEDEAKWLSGWGLPDPLVPPRGLRLRGGRRPLRVRAADLAWEPVATDALRLVFRLPPGSYATVLIASVFGPADDSPQQPG